jgi:electron transfer flavoprotein alpha subunit
MRQVLVLAERGAGGAAVCRATCALLTVARRLGTSVAVLGGPADATSAALLGRFGAATIHAVLAPEVNDHPTAAAVETLVELARRTSPAAILIASSRDGLEIAGRVAVRLDSGILSDVIDVRTSLDGPVAVQSVHNGRYLLESQVVRGIPVFAVRTEHIVPEPSPVTPTVDRVRMTFPSSVHAVRRVPRQRKSRDQPPELSTAAVVVAGGRGVGSRTAFDLVRRLAAQLDGAVGASHTATELGWCPREAQVDQTGAVVHPSLYLALGISGSMRHRAGMCSADTIVAIDRDPAAPIFELSDLAVVGDVHEVVPELVAEIKRRKAQPIIGTQDVPEA